MNNRPYNRDPFAQGSKRQTASSAVMSGGIKNLRTILLGCIAAIIVINAAVVAVSGGLLSCERASGVADGGSDSNGQVTQATDENLQPDIIYPDTAYYNVLPAQGDYAELIDKYVTYERGVMQADEVVVTFTGDCTLGTWPESNVQTNYTALYNQSGSPTYSFDNVKSLFQNDDYTYINLETTLTDSTKKLETQYFNFKGSPSWAKDMIADSGVDGCNIANNHAYDWGQSGYDETVQSLGNAGVNVGDEKLVIVTQLNDVELVLLSGNYIYPCGGEQLYGDDLTNYLVEKIKEYKRSDNIVIVSAHWGLERQHDANSDQTTPAHKFINAGADMVVGHHPHTLQGIELYNNKYIFYSLGNFAFGGKNSTDEVNRVALMLRVRLALRDGVAAVTGVLGVPCYTTSAESIAINNYKPKPLCSLEAADIQTQLISYSSGMSYGATSFECPATAWTVSAKTGSTTSDSDAQ